MVSDSLTSYVKAYNAVVRTAVLQKFGHDVFEECARDAGKALEERRITNTKPK